MRFVSSAVTEHTILTSADIEVLITNDYKEQTAVLRVLADILLALDTGNLAVFFTVGSVGSF